MNKFQAVTLAASALFLANHAEAGRIKPPHVAANPAGVNAQPGDGSTMPPTAPPSGQPAAANGQPTAPPGAPAAGTPAAGAPAAGAPVASQAQAKPAGPSGPPPVVIGPDGVERPQAVRVAGSTSNGPGMFNTSKRRGMRIGVSTTGGATPSTNDVRGSMPLPAAGERASSNSPSVASFAIPLPNLVGGASSSATIAAASGGVTGDASGSVHTWTRNGTTYNADAGSAGDGVSKAVPGSTPGVGILANSSVTTSNAPTSAPVGIVNDMLIRIGGMSKVMPARQAAASPN